MTVDIIALIIQWIVIVSMYLIIGFGVGYLAGVLLANLIFGRGKPLRMDSHIKSMQKAAEHNKQWNPTHEKWQK